MSELLNIIKSRKSVRSFDGKPLSDAKENGLSSPVLTGETMYVAGMVKKGNYADVAFGFSLEKLVLYAWSLGIGTTWIGGTMKRELFEQAAGVSDDEMMPCMSPLGYPAKKHSVKETLMRKGEKQCLNC